MRVYVHIVSTVRLREASLSYMTRKASIKSNKRSKVFPLANLIMLAEENGIDDCATSDLRAMVTPRSLRVIFQTK